MSHRGGTPCAPVCRPLHAIYMNILFGSKDLQKLWRPKEDSGGEDNGQVTIIGGSKLFHGAPMLAVKAASRLVDMVFFGSPERDLEMVARLNSFIWIPWEEVDKYIAKSEAVLIGPGFMRFRSEGVSEEEKMACDEECRKSREITQNFLKKFPHKRWVIDGGSLQVMDKEWIPKNSILTPNDREFELLFGKTGASQAAAKYSCVIVRKGPVAHVTNGETTYEIEGGNAGLTKGGTGDVLAGVIAGLAAKNPPLLAAAAGTFLVKETADKLFAENSYWYNADDVAEKLVFPA